jgi:hypothetical protein
LSGGASGAGNFKPAMLRIAANSLPLLNAFGSLSKRGFRAVRIG